jgi:pimeloyl-ACP methyl ester carboxylesterase
MASAPSVRRLRGPQSTNLVLFILALGAAAAAYRLRRGTTKVVTGTFSNGMGYARIGAGARSLLWIGGPSIGAPGGMYLKMMTRMLRPFVRHGYTVWLVGLKPNLAAGCTIADMAEDYAKLIAEEFGGKIDVVVGDSTGGMIGFHLAARHPDVFGHIVIAVAAYSMTDEGRAANLASARLLSAGRKTDAAAALVTLMYPGIRPAWIARLLAWAVAQVSFTAAFNPRDVLVGAEAVNAVDAREILRSISVPVLLVCGDRDRWFAREAYQQTADLIPHCTLKMYEGKDHMGAMFDKRLPRDVLGFVQKGRPEQPEASPLTSPA